MSKLLFNEDFEFLLDSKYKFFNISLTSGEKFRINQRLIISKYVEKINSDYLVKIETQDLDLQFFSSDVQAITAEKVVLWNKNDFFLTDLLEKDFFIIRIETSNRIFNLEKKYILEYEELPEYGNIIRLLYKNIFRKNWYKKKSIEHFEYYIDQDQIFGYRLELKK